MAAVLSALLLATTPAVFQPTEALDQIVQLFTGKEIGEVGGARTAVDKRLKLAACAAPQLEWRTAAHDAVVIRCMAPEWRIYVPVNAAPPAPQVIAAAAAAVPVRPEKAPPVIRRGDPIVVEAGAAGFSIAREGVAMGDAPAGGRLLVKVDERRAPIQAIAVEQGRATLPGWGD
jgi:flagella basal body P-ring formation protein FlgA